MATLDKARGGGCGGKGTVASMLYGTVVRRNGVSSPQKINCARSSTGDPWGRVNQQPPMHQLAVLFTEWAAFFHSAPDGVHHSPFLFAAHHYNFLFYFVCVCVCSWAFFPWTWPATRSLSLPHKYPHKYYTNLGTLFIIPYSHSYLNN